MFWWVQPAVCCVPNLRGGLFSDCALLGHQQHSLPNVQRALQSWIFRAGCMHVDEQPGVRALLRRVFKRYIFIGVMQLVCRPRVLCVRQLLARYFPGCPVHAVDQPRVSSVSRDQLVPRQHVRARGVHRVDQCRVCDLPDELLCRSVRVGPMLIVEQPSMLRVLAVVSDRVVYRGAVLRVR